jgi:hypothetical protein
MSISVTESDFIHRSIHNRSGEILIVSRNTEERKQNPAFQEDKEGVIDAI